MRWLADVARDVRLALRALRRMPGLAATVIVSLGIGIGVNTTVFSWIEAILVHPIPGVARGADFYFIEPETDTGIAPGASWLEYRDLQRGAVPAFNDLVAFRMAPFSVGERGASERTYGLLVSGNYFDALGLRPQHGRLIGTSDTARDGGEPVVVIGDAFWRGRLAGDPTAVGRTLHVNDRDLTIIGIAPPKFQGTVLGLSFDLFVPATAAPILQNDSRELTDRQFRGYSIIGKLRPGASAREAQAEIDASQKALAAAYPASNAGMHAELLPFWQALRGPQRMLLPALVLLQGVLILLLVVVCANVATLVLSRANSRVREMSVRVTLGAGRPRVIRFLLTEQVVLALGGVVLGVFFAAWGSTALRAVPMIGAFPIRFQTGLDAIGVIVAAVLGVVSGIAFGAPAAWQLARVEPMSALRAGALAAPPSATRDILMALQIALSVLVLVVGGLFLRSMRSGNDVDLGFRKDGVTLAAYDLTARRVSQSSDAELRLFAGNIVRRLRAESIVESAAIATSVPLDIHGLPQRSFAVEGRASDPSNPDLALSNVVTPGYFQTLGISFIAGHDFASLDDLATAPQAIVNEVFVRRYLQGQEPLGRRLQTGRKTYEICGVVRTSVYETLGEQQKSIIYLSYRDRPSSRGEIHVRARAGAERNLPSLIARTVRDEDPSLPVYDVRTFNDHIERNLFLRRIPARMFVLLAPLLLLLTAIGIYAVVNYSVGQRGTEIGLRLALGATPLRVVREIVAEHFRLIGLSVLGGSLLSVFVVRRFGSDTPVDWLVLIGVPLLLVAVGLVASWLPSRRAARVPPTRALAAN